MKTLGKLIELIELIELIFYDEHQGSKIFGYVNPGRQIST